MIETLTPRLLIRRPIEAVVIPLPTEETTPPVTKMYLGIRASNELSALSYQPSALSFLRPAGGSTRPRRTGRHRAHATGAPQERRPRSKNKPRPCGHETGGPSHLRPEADS